ncbi:hypothetical protein BDV28DRAFT_11685 [Aspergillus coremiiformis]|uniref:FAD/NAD(P)-binding domain-containing protein n=1 Tax=Aspergillus coremiiformis TaxID=138285 RepID=A0A5N6ZEL0_9EURO|nr:hypothetical protein BDV28DRAFT_11685 [Aspergillus coremiiformis]
MFCRECSVLIRRPEADRLPSMDTHTIIIGNGPSAMILSFILHGHVPYYSPNPPHPDPLLHAKLKDNPALLDADADALTEHFAASRLSYSTQALPVNVLFDTLFRPSIDVEELGSITNIEWRYEPAKAVPHVVFGNAPRPGGQWTENLVPASWDIQTLSYASMLSLPGYSFAEHYRRVTGKDLPAFTRPSRQETADYFRAYPDAVGVADVFRNNETLTGISRTEHGFFIQSHNIHCTNLVLASGIFSEVLEPRPLLRPLLSLPPVPETPLLIIGSGFSAADVIISAPKDQKIIHIFKWDPEGRPSPLRGCHQHAYPEYAGVYRLMRRAAVAAAPATTKRPGRVKRAASGPFLESRSWDEVYEGLPNTEIIAVDKQKEGTTITLRHPDGTTFSRFVRSMVYATGRRGSLGYLDHGLLSEVLGCGDGDEISPVISGQTLRHKAFDSMEIANNVFIIGSLTGDTLIRFAHGSCVQTAGKLIRTFTGAEEAWSKVATPSRPQGSSPGVMQGIDGHDVYGTGSQIDKIDSCRTEYPLPEKSSFLGTIWKALNAIW